MKSTPDLPPTIEPGTGEWQDERAREQRARPAVTEADADLLRRLRQALDCRYLHTLLTRQWPYLRPWLDRGFRLEVERLFPRGAAGFVIEYALVVNEDAGYAQSNGVAQPPPSSVLIELHAEGTAEPFEALVESLRKRRRGQLSREAGTALPLAWLDELGGCARVPGLDRRLEGLVLHHQPARIESLLDALCRGSEAQPACAAGAGWNSTLLAHRLGKRAVLQLRPQATEPVPGSGLIAKLYPAASSRAMRMATCLRWLTGAAAQAAVELQVPGVSGVDEALQLLLMEAVPGVSLDRLPSDRLRAGMWQAGRALHALQRIDVLANGGHETDARRRAWLRRTHGAADELVVLSDWVALHVALDTPIAASLALALQSLREVCDALPDPTHRTLCHRDFHEKQVLCATDRCWMIDFDTLCIGDPALDVGNFIAHLELMAIERGIESSEWLAAFESGYGERIVDGSVFGRRVAFYADATRLRVAAIHAFSTRRVAAARALLDRALTSQYRSG
ncbi:MAG: aminoglycoside phosphotransferase family protein [Gammaproteobacteria bacterium]|nr:aminoglycoside phosphotransferase family protein [Gammaproteobacteria bacterium]